jgi:hypothetical protein
VGWVGEKLGERDDADRKNGVDEGEGARNENPRPSAATSVVTTGKGSIMSRLPVSSTAEEPCFRRRQAGGACPLFFLYTLL